MELNDDEKEYGKIIRSLHYLKKVNAPDNFETNLIRKINTNYQKERPGFWHDILIPSRLIPTATLAMVLIALYIIKFNNQNTNNPLSVQPGVRSDVMYSNGSESSIDELIFGQLKNNPSGRKNKQNLSKINGYPALTASIIKTGLNFRQANITKSQREEVIALKQKFETMIKNSKIK